MKRILLGLLLAGCGRAPAAEPAVMREFTDARGRAVRVPFPPRRIVSIIPSATELLFAAGAGDEVAAVTTYCTFPPEAARKPKIGNILLDWEALAALKPDLVVTSFALTQKTTRDLEAKGYAVFAADASSFEEIASRLRTLGELTGHAREGQRAAEALLARVRAVQPFEGPTFYFEHSSDPLGTTGPESYLGRALAQAGGKNIVEGGWTSIDWERVLAKDPEVLLIAHDQKDGLQRRAGWRSLRAVKSGRVYFVPKEHFVYPTPRLAEGLEEAARIFHAKGP